MKTPQEIARETAEKINHDCFNSVYERIDQIAAANCILAAITAATQEQASDLDLLADLTAQECSTAKVEKDYNGQIAGTLVTDSGAMSVRAAALRRLAELGRFRIVAEGGRMVVGYWPEHDPRNVAREQEGKA